MVRQTECTYLSALRPDGTSCYLLISPKYFSMFSAAIQTYLYFFHNFFLDPVNSDLSIRVEEYIHINCSDLDPLAYGPCFASSIMNRDCSTFNKVTKLNGECSVSLP